MVPSNVRQAATNWSRPAGATATAFLATRSNVRSAHFLALGARYDTLVASALATPDHDEAQRNAAEAMHLLVDEEAAAIPLAGIYRIYAMSDRVHGFDPNPSRVNLWWSTVWLSR